MHIANRPAIQFLAITGLIFLIYSSTFNAPFELDDFHNIVDNPAIKDFRYFLDPSMLENIGKVNGLNISLFKTRYIGYLTFAINYSLHGLDVRGYHAVNIIIHIFNSLLLYWLMTLTFRTPFFLVAGRPLLLPDNSRDFIALFTALLFAVHPIQTQAVTYIVQRFASLATLFYLLSLVLYIKWKVSKEQQAKGYIPCVMLYAGSLLSAVLAMKTKEFAFTLPVVMAAYELMFFDGKIMKRLLYLTPFFLAILIIPLSLTDTGNSLSELSRINEAAAKVSGAHGKIARADYLITQFRVIVTYIRLLFFPVNQNIDYDYPIFNSFFSPPVVLSFLFLLSVIIAGIYLYRLSKRSERKDSFWLRLISFGIFWFFIALPAESGVIPIIDVMFEHRVYLPSVGFFIALIAALGAGMQRLASRAAFLKKAVVYVMLLVIIVMSGAATARNTLWKDNESLWEDAVEKSPNKARPHTNLGLAYQEQSRFEKAINEYQAALKIDPNDEVTHTNLGNAYAELGRWEEAINELVTALKYRPNFASAHYNLGRAYQAHRLYGEAIGEYQAALKINPNDAKTHNNLGLAYMDQGRFEDAIKEFQAVLKIDPSYPLAGQFLEFLQKKQ